MRTYILFMSVAAALLMGCGDNNIAPYNQYNNEVKSKGDDIQNYRTVVINSQTWMAENLDNDVEGSKCYNNDPAYCEKYGRLYTWDAAMTACPAGWHLPTDAEWTALTNYVGGLPTAGTKLKSSEGWNSYSGVPAGTDEHNFSALPGGYGYSDGTFDHVGDFGSWWSATEYNDGSAYNLFMNYDDESVVRLSYVNKTRLSSARCLQD